MTLHASIIFKLSLFFLALNIDNSISAIGEYKTIKIKPIEAAKKENLFWVAWHLESNAVRNRRYPEIVEGSMVRVNIKPKHGATKDMILAGALKNTKYR